jgi:hypothetical protein
MMLAQNAEAATEVAQLAASDNRVGAIATLLVPALGWVGFNMLQPALNQLERMSDKVVTVSDGPTRALGWLGWGKRYLGGGRKWPFLHGA